MAEYDKLDHNHSLEYIHYGREHFSHDEFKELENRESAKHNKPIGGYWASPVEGEKTWLSFCRGEELRVCPADEKECFTLRDDANILVINNMQDLEHLPWIKMDNVYGIDYEQMRDDKIDGIEVRFTAIKPDDSPIHGFDADTLIVFNPAIIQIDREKSYDPEYHNDYKDNVGQTVEIGYMSPLHGVILDKDDRTVFDLDGYDGYKNPDDFHSTARFELNTPSISCTVDGYCNIILPNGNIKLDERGLPDTSARDEMTSFLQTWDVVKINDDKKYRLEGMISITRQEEGPPLDRSDIYRKIDLDRTYEHYTVESYTLAPYEDRGLFIKDDYGNYFHISENCFMREAQGPLPQGLLESRFGPDSEVHGPVVNGAEDERLHLIPNEPIDMYLRKDDLGNHTININIPEVSTIQKDDERMLSVNTDYFSPVSTEPQRMDTFRVISYVNIPVNEGGGYMNGLYVQDRQGLEYRVFPSDEYPEIGNHIYYEYASPPDIEGHIDQGQIVEPGHEITVELPVTRYGGIMISEKMEFQGITIDPKSRSITVDEREFCRDPEIGEREFSHDSRDEMDAPEL